MRSIWLNNCVGERNYRWFLSFLYLNALLMGYGVWATTGILLHDVEALRLFTAVFTKGNKQIKANYSIVFQYLLGTRTEVCMVGVLCVIMGLLVFCFAVYHTALAASNTTTNESVKWGRLSEERDYCMKEYTRAVRAIGEAQAAVDAAQRVCDGQPEGGTMAAKLELGKARAALEEARKPPPHWEKKLQAAGLAGGGAAAPPSLTSPAPLPRSAFDRGCLRNLCEMAWPGTPKRKQ